MNAKNTLLDLQLYKTEKIVTFEKLKPGIYVQLLIKQLFCC